MGKINLLSKQMAELIAAGEVIERPASVIKELLENAADAGSSSVTVELQQGGIAYLRVSDNGCGIAREEMATAFLSHATSKVKNPEDLNNIYTMGFRGEALASIAAMCRVEVLSKTEDAQSGVRYRIEGGQEMECGEAGCVQGTTIVVRDMFYNTPARMKFLKKDATEAGAVAAVVDRAALANPKISYRFIRDGKTVLQTPGNGKLSDAVYSVLGGPFFKTLLPLCHERGGIRVEGFVSRPQESRGSRSLQCFFLNGRYIRSGTCTAALEQAYRTMMMKGKFPACVLHITLPPSVFDINVHPAKLEVRFQDEKLVFESVYWAVRSALGNAGERMGAEARLPLPEPAAADTKGAPPHALAPELRQERQTAAGTVHIDAAAYRAMGGLPPPHSQNGVRRGGGAHLSVQIEKTQAEREAERLRAMRWETPELTGEPAKSGALGPFGAPVAGGESAGGKGEAPLPKADDRALLRGAAQSQPPQFSQKEPSLNRQAQAKQQSEQATLWHKEGAAPRRYDGARLLGELMQTYILLEWQDRLILIDKHAAHERLLFEQLKEQEEGVTRQLLLTPLAVTLGKEEHAAVVQNMRLLRSMGFLCEDFGDGSVLVREIPARLDMEQTEGVLAELAARLQAGEREPSPTALDEIYHLIACKAAIKAHDLNEKQELEQLVCLLNEHEDVNFCPHGRPIATVITKGQLEKMFGRA